jgi:hypothetical protein
MSKNKLPSGPLSPPLLLIVAGEKGGVGKSLLSLAIADVFQIHEQPLSILQIDSQARLGSTLKQEITTIRVDRQLARRDPAAAARAYTPVYDAIEAIRTGGRSVLIDVGANEAAGLAHWMGLVDLAADLAEWQITTAVAIPYLAEGEAIRQAGTTADLLLPKLGEARLALVENGRDGSIGDLHPASEALSDFRKILAPRIRNAATLRMPLIEAGSWRPFEAAGCRPVEVVAMSVEEVVRVTGLPKAEAKIVRGDVAAWLSDMLGEIDKIVQIGSGDRA